MSLKFSARALNLPAFARAGETLSGADPLQEYERLSEESRGPEGNSMVNWLAQGAWRGRPGEAEAVWLHLTAETTVGLTCQRCLTPVAVPLAADRWFRFVTDEAIAEAEDNDAEEDLLVLSDRFDLHELVEDELLMELPLVPRHAVCPVELPHLSGEGGRDEEPHPFAALEGLRGKKLS